MDLDHQESSCVTPAAAPSTSNVKKLEPLSDSEVRALLTIFYFSTYQFAVSKQVNFQQILQSLQFRTYNIVINCYQIKKEFFINVLVTTECFRTMTRLLSCTVFCAGLQDTKVCRNSLGRSRRLLGEYETKEMVCPTCNRHFLGLLALQTHIGWSHCAPVLSSSSQSYSLNLIYYLSNNTVLRTPFCIKQAKVVKNKII